MVAIKKIGDFLWEVEKKENPEMRVPVHIYANEAIKNSVGKDRTLTQAINAAKLPSIVKHMLLMPDAHEGYSFPIGGVAAFDADEGIIAPGAVGYDINCLLPGTPVVDIYGAAHVIEKLYTENVGLQTFDSSKKEIVKSNVVLYMKRKEQNNVLRIRTTLGNKLYVTKDHPVLTQRGMVLAKDLKNDDKLIVKGWVGVKYEKPEHKLLLSEPELCRAMGLFGIEDKGNGKAQVLATLRRLNLNVLYFDSEKLPLLIKLMGFVFGDGTIPKRSKKGAITTAFYGKKEDLEDIAKDITSLGFKSSMNKRSRHHHIKTIYGTREFDFEEHSLQVGSGAFATLLMALGTPFGKKASKRYNVPQWILDAKKWQKRLFLAAYFGAELSKPRTVPNDINFQVLTVNVSKLVSLEGNAIEFLRAIKLLLSSMDIETGEPSRVEGYRYDGVDGQSIGNRISILSNTENLKKFFGTVGYLYNREKERLASLAYIYLNYLEHIRDVLDTTRRTAYTLHNSLGAPLKEVMQLLVAEGVTKSFVVHSAQKRIGPARIWNGAEKFSTFSATCEVGQSGLTFSDITTIDEIPYRGDVYDITVDDENHNFIAGGYVVSNCGIRVIKTNLSEKEVRPKLPKLMDALFKNVPSGVGSKNSLGFTPKDLDRIAVDGIDYVIAKGFGVKDDIEHTEEYGKIAGADPEKVSDLAKKRGLQQLGTLGAGNHFAEVQKIDKILDSATAKAFGLEDDQVVVMLHSGSRGYGHQVCSDYLRICDAYLNKHNIKPPDPELMYVPIGTREADDYLAGMKSAINFAFANRQIMMHFVRKSFEETFDKSADALGMDLLYDLSHNIVKLEEHTVDGKRRKVYVHRKGATRAFAPGRKEIPKAYRDVGQPVLIPGSMGTASYILAGREGSMTETFGSSCHGAGRVMSRHQALREIPAAKTLGSMEDKKIAIRVRDKKLVSEEAEWAYKDVDEVVRSVEGAGLCAAVARLVPLGVAKG